MDPAEIYDFVQTVASEIGYEQAQCFNDYGPSAIDGNHAKYMKQCLKNGTDRQFLGEMLADHIYDDAGFLQDIIGDRIFGEPNRTEILDYLDSVGHTAMKTAVANLRR